MCISVLQIDNEDLENTAEEDDTEIHVENSTLLCDLDESIEAEMEGFIIPHNDDDLTEAEQEAMKLMTVGNLRELA